MRFALKNGADFIGLSFTKNADDVLAAKRVAMQTGRRHGLSQRSKTVRQLKISTRSYRKLTAQWSPEEI